MANPHESYEYPIMERYCNDAALRVERYNMAVSPASGSIWLRFCPQPVSTDPLLQSLKSYLEQPEVLRQLESYDADGRYPNSVIDYLKSLGLNQIFSDVGPEEPKATAYHLSALNYITARATASLAITVGVNSLALLCAYRGATPRQLEEILSLVRNGTFSALALTELDQGSDLFGIQSCATAGTLSAQGSFTPIIGNTQATYYLLRASKQLINGGNRHPLLFVLLKDRCNLGTDANSRNMRGIHSLFWVERDTGAIDSNRWDTLPAPAADISEVHLENVLVGADHRLGKEGEGLGLIQDTLAMSRGGVAALAAGSLSRARDLALSYASRRKVYGYKLGELGGIAGHLVRIDAIDRAATAASLRATAWVNACGVRAAPYTAVAKMMSSRLAEEGVTEGRHLLGARALLNQLPYARLIGDVLLFSVFDGTSHLMLEELQMYLSMETRRWDEKLLKQSDTVSTMRSLYAIPMRSLVDVCQNACDLHPFAMSVHASNLSRLAGDVHIQQVEELAQMLLVVTAEAKRQHKWGDDQDLRFALAEVYALVEVILGLIELFDPVRREIFTDYRPISHPVDELGYQHALGWLGNRACSRLAECAMKAGLWQYSRAAKTESASGSIPDIQARFLRGQDEISRALARKLLDDATAK